MYQRRLFKWRPGHGPCLKYKFAIFFNFDRVIVVGIFELIMNLTERYLAVKGGHYRVICYRCEAVRIQVL